MYMPYRQFLFDDLRAYHGPAYHPKRILEIGPKDGQDSWRLVTLRPQTLTVVDQPNRLEGNRVWYDRLKRSYTNVEYWSVDITTRDFRVWAPYDLIWCTGVLYHLTDQLALLKKLRTVLTPGGTLVLESATTRHPLLRWTQSVQVIYPYKAAYEQRYHLAPTCSHLPSRRAIEAWLWMAGYASVRPSACHRRQSWRLALNRAAFIARNP